MEHVRAYRQLFMCAMIDISMEITLLKNIHYPGSTSTYTEPGQRKLRIINDDRKLLQLKNSKDIDTIVIACLKANTQKTEA